MDNVQAQSFGRSFKCYGQTHKVAFQHIDVGTHDRRINLEIASHSPQIRNWNDKWSIHITAEELEPATAALLNLGRGEYESRYHGDKKNRGYQIRYNRKGFIGSVFFQWSQAGQQRYFVIPQERLFELRAFFLLQLSKQCGLNVSDTLSLLRYSYFNATGQS